MPATIAVGVDGSDSSLAALRWALQSAGAGDARVVVVVAKPHPGTNVTAESARIRAIRGDDHVTDAVAAVHRVAPRANLDIQVADGSLTEVLLQMCDRVDLLVVGHHGHQGWRGIVTPSVSGQLVIRTTAALCVVRSLPEPPSGVVVVGHDGRASDPAAHFAAARADQRGARLVVATAWRYPSDTRATSAETSGLLEKGAAADQAVIVDELREAFPRLPIATAVGLGSPVEVLADLGASADLVVVGSHRHGVRHSGLARLVLGSVALDLLRTLNVPVAVVPHD
jgi:nucleotide-binding universal stress UspA family protein